MEGLPNLEINILNNQLGQVEPSDDAVMGLILSGVATANIALSEPKQIFNLKGAEDLLLTAAYDVTNTTDVYKQIKDFYTTAGNGTELWIMIIAKTTTMTTACDKTGNIVKKLLNGASGRIVMWGITRTADAAYEPTTVDGFDDDVSGAVLKAHDLCEEFAVAFKPCRALVGVREFTGVPANLKNFKLSTCNRVGVVLGSTFSTGEPAVGYTLGQFANRPVQRNIGRVKDGATDLVQAYLSDGSLLEENESAWDSIHNKGYIFFRKFANKSGYYFTYDPACCPDSDDYNSLSRGRVADKMHRITHATYTDEILDDLEVDENGYLNPAVVKSYQQKIENAISLKMVPSELSGVTCEMDAAQNILSTNQVTIKKIGGRPKGQAKYISISLGFTNPLNS